MATYKIRYGYTYYEETIHGKREIGYDIYEADNAQDAVDQCRQDFYPENELEILSVSKRTECGWLPVFYNTWY